MPRPSVRCNPASSVGALAGSDVVCYTPASVITPHMVRSQLTPYRVWKHMRGKLGEVHYHAIQYKDDPNPLSPYPVSSDYLTIYIERSADLIVV